MTDTTESYPLKQRKNKRFPFLYWLKPLYELAGVQFDQMMEIVDLKAKILGRTEQAQALNKKKKGTLGIEPLLQKEASFFSWGKVISYLITSLFLMFYGFILEAPTTMLSIIFTIGFVMQFLAIVTSFPVLILDTKDYTILTTKPLSSKTIAAAKTTVATLYMICTSGTIYGLTIIPFIWKGLWSVLPLMLVAIVISNLVCVALSYLLYGLVLKFYDGEKLKDLISIFQIVLTVFIMIGYQLVAQLQNVVNLSVKVQFSWWHLLAPPLWLSNFSATLIGPETLIPGLLSGAMILILLGIHFFFTGKLLEENLSKMLSEGETKRGKYQLKLAFQERLAKLIYKDKQEQAFFILGYSISANDRKMKQTIYPMYVSMLILPGIMIFNAWRNNPQPLQMVFDQNSWLIFSLYFAGITIGNIVLYVKRTESPAGSWVFNTLPIHSQKKAYKAVALNLILRYVVVPIVLFAVGIAFLAGLDQLVGLMIIVVFTIFVTLITLKSESIEWPFSYDLSYAEGKKGIVIMRNFVALSCFVGLHALCQYLLAPFGVPILLVVTVLATTILWKRI